MVHSKELLSRRRQLSPHVCTRLYRAPEIVLIEKQYDAAVDVWALGCVLAELMITSSPYIEHFSQITDKKERKHAIKMHVDARHIFYGDSCFPLSP